MHYFSLPDLGYIYRLALQVPEGFALLVEHLAEEQTGLPWGSSQRIQAWPQGAVVKVHILKEPWALKQPEALQRMRESRSQVFLPGRTTCQAEKRTSLVCQSSAMEARRLGVETQEILRQLMYSLVAEAVLE